MLVICTSVGAAPTKCALSIISMEGNLFTATKKLPLGKDIIEFSSRASGKFISDKPVHQGLLEPVSAFPGVLNFIEEVETFYMTKVRI